MRHSSRPERLLAFKMRLSKQLGYRVIAVILKMKIVKKLNLKFQVVISYLFISSYPWT